MKNKEQTAQKQQMTDVTVVNINSRNVFNQMVRNIKTDKNDIIIMENIYAKNLNDYDGINVINDDEYFDHIICLINILAKEIE